MRCVSFNIVVLFVFRSIFHSVFFIFRFSEGDETLFRYIEFFENIIEYSLQYFKINQFILWAIRNIIGEHVFLLGIVFSKVYWIILYYTFVGLEFLTWVGKFFGVKEIEDPTNQFYLSNNYQSHKCLVWKKQHQRAASSINFYWLDLFQFLKWKMNVFVLKSNWIWR